MTEIEQKALELWGPGVTAEVNLHNFSILGTAFLEMREQHEAFRQEVSDALEKRGFYIDDRDLGRFIIAKPDPLVEVMNAWWDSDGYASIETFRAALAARGLKIVEDK